jgi:hypothetical protein
MNHRPIHGGYPEVQPTVFPALPEGYANRPCDGSPRDPDIMVECRHQEQCVLCYEAEQRAADEQAAIEAGGVC